MGNGQSTCLGRVRKALEPCCKCRTYSVGETPNDGGGTELTGRNPNADGPPQPPGEPASEPPVEDQPPAEEEAPETLPEAEALVDDGMLRLPKPLPWRNSLADGGRTLKVASVDILATENGQDHHTWDYELMERPAGAAQLVIRRGQPFHLQLKLNRNFNKDTDAISFIFTVADARQANLSNGTIVAVPMRTDNTGASGNGWWAKLVESKSFSIKVQVCTSASSAVGVWKLDIDSKAIETSTSLSYSMPTPIYLLFNAWCKDDQVYMENEAHRKEYVLADSGLIWRGSHSRMRPCPWNFAQFEKDVLECSMWLLSNVGKLSVGGRSDPVRVSRAISAAVNSSDDNGVLMGNWSSDYSGGTEPTKWQGSMLILQQYWKTRSPVKYGQCWVFSGVVTSVCRALGLPSRSVTNFSSAHDTPGSSGGLSLTVDTFIGDDGKVLEDLNSDSIWNFHVWNEVWMERPDLEPGDYGGWQAIDATPQEESDGMYRCGPASVAAVKRGEVRKSYDTAFQFAEVNADKVYWRYRGANQPLKLIDKRTDEIGLFISTKAVGKFEREDITDQYKFKDNSAEERDVVLKAVRQCDNIFSRYYLNEALEDVRFDFQLRDDIVIGAPFNVIVTVGNKNRTKDYTVVVTLRVDSMLYHGTLKGNVKQERFERTIRAGSAQNITMPVSYQDYAPEISDQGSFMISCLASVKETDFEFFSQDDFRVRKPDISVRASKEVALGDQFDVTVSLKNPLPVALSRGKFVVEGAGLGVPHKVPLGKAVAPGQDAMIMVKMTAAKAGQKTIAVKFYSEELNDVDGYLNIDVTDNDA